MSYTATYSPDDNKIRLYASTRLDPETYARVKAAGFAWAPKQDLFVAPMWTPAREDLAVELAGDLEDEDKTLTERAEERAERFEDYSEKRADDADRAHAAVARIADGIPMGQPILVGHHSEKRARKDAERIRSGMDRALKMWRTAEYWERRAAGAVRAAKYKELPGVRYRRIKGLEADSRKHAKDVATARSFSALWSVPGLTVEAAARIANHDRVRFGLWSELTDGKITAEAAAAEALAGHASAIAWAERWLEHIANRLAYERAMLGTAGDIVAKREGFALEVGGRVTIDSRCGGVEGGHPILRVTKKGGAIVSVTIATRFQPRRVTSLEEITGYKPPTAADAAACKRATKLAPLVNVDGEGFVKMTSAEWSAYAKRREPGACIGRAAKTATHGPMRYRRVMREGWKESQVFVTDMKITEREALEATS